MDEFPNHQNNSAFEYVSRKKKNKRGKRGILNPTLRINHAEMNHCSPNALEPTGVDTDSGNEITENNEQGNFYVETEEPENSDMDKADRISTDSMMVAPPKIYEPESYSGIEDDVPDSVSDRHEQAEGDITSRTIDIVVTSGDKDLVAQLRQVAEETNEVQHKYFKSEGGQSETEVGECYTLINHRALPKNASTYELEKFEKKVLIIFNQAKIEGYKPRLGTDKDVEALKRTFENFNFEVVEYKDLTKEEIFKRLKTFSEENFTDYGCVGVAVLTHGSNNGLLRAKDQQYSEIEIINHFKSNDKPTLVTKPKIIIIQACRGMKIVQGTPVFYSAKISKDHDEDLEPYILPSESDMLILHSSYVGSPSHRDEVHGSWLIQSLCNKIDELAATHDLESIITEVKREVAIDKCHEEYNKRTLEMTVNKQMPVVTSTLIRKLYLRKFGEELDNCSELRMSSIHLQGAINDSKNVLDGTTPNTPLLVQFGPCSCFLDHFTYIRNCLRYFTEENPYDETAQNLLEVANVFEEGVEFNTAKEKMTKAICKHLLNNARDSAYYKYLHFYKH